MKRGKKGQTVFGMSFGVIFSIILIVFIVIVGIIVVKVFLNTRDCGQIKLFIDDFKGNVDGAWRSDELMLDFNSKLSSGIEYVCFANLSSSVKGSWKEIGEEISVYDNGDNLFFYPVEEACVPNHRIARLDIGEITRFDNPYCVVVQNGDLTVRIEKEINRGLVVVR